MPMSGNEHLIKTQRFANELKKMMINHTLDLLDTNVEMHADIIRAINNAKEGEILSLYLEEHMFDEGITEVLVTKVRETLDLPF